MRVGDLLGSGTISGATRESRRSLLELSWRGEAPFALDGGKMRSFIEDGDLLSLRGAGLGMDIGSGSVGAIAGFRVQMRATSLVPDARPPR